MSENHALPMFYRAPEPLSSVSHASWRLKESDAAFAADAAYVPLVVAEFSSAQRSYPIVFAAGNTAPLAILGLEQANLFIDDGKWAETAYVPAYVRRYPFGFIATTNPDGFALAIDTGSDRVLQAGDEGQALFEAGRPTELTQQAVRFCEIFQSDAAATGEFMRALQSKELLIDRRADATLPDGRKLGLDGFQIVDAAKFARLDAGTVVEWHVKGWLALIHFHLASLDRFTDLLARQAKRAAAGRAVAADEAGVTTH